MNGRKVAYFLGPIAIVIGTIFALMGGDDRPRSPRALSPVSANDTTPGSRHGFGFRITYTVVDKKMHEGKQYAVVKSYERDVEIWTPLPEITSMKVGARFSFTPYGMNFAESLILIDDKNR